MNRAPISLCMISRDDAHLEQCLKVFRDYVEEICVVITGKDDITEEICKKYADKYVIFSDCNDGYDRIVDFSMARNKSIELATQPWIIWADSDDEIVGLENLIKLIASYDTNRKDLDGIAFLFPYEYGYDGNGNIITRQYRERLCYKKGDYHFVNPVHECLIPDAGKRCIQVKSDEVIYKHKRQFIVKKQDPGRNLRILQHYFNNGGTDVRNMYYAGLEYFNHNDFPNATKYLTEYLSKSGWDDEKAMAWMKLIEIAERQGNPAQVLTYAFELIKLKQDWFESYYAACKASYYLSKWQQCVMYGQFALKCPPTDTLLFVNEAERFFIHTYLNVALNNIGDIKGALESAEAGLKGLPGQPQLTNNIRIYQSALGIKRPQENIGGIVFVTGSMEPWSPDTVKTTGIGGSEMMLINQAKNLAALGNKVTVFAACDGVFDGVEYRNVSKFGDIKCDTLVVSRYTPYLGDNFNVDAKLKLLWVHDMFAHQATNELLLKADKILCLTQWHKDFFCKYHNVNQDQVIVTRNGIDLVRFEQHILKGDITRNQYKCVNSSSPDRSWPVLLSVWPTIKARVPQAELHLFYGFNNWKIAAASDPNQMALINNLEQQIKNTDGIVFHDRVNQDELAKEFLSAGVWCHPTWFQETSCITAMESRMASLHIVSTKLGGLIETVGDHGVLLEGEWTSPEYQQKFIDETIKALNTPERECSGVEFSLIELAQLWDSMFRRLTEEKKINPINKYQPTKKYQDRKPRPECNKVKLNIACGTSVFPYDGWHNFDYADFDQYFQFIRTIGNSNGMPEHQRKLWQFSQDGGEIKYSRQDMLQPFTTVDDNTADFIYLGQCIEHITYKDAQKLLKECHRMLKDGGIIRLTTPDLRKLMVAYQADEMNKFAVEQPEDYATMSRDGQFSMLIFGAHGDDGRREGHCFCYSEQTMQKQLEQAGFKEVSFTWPKCGKNKEIAMEIEDFGFSHSMIVEATK